MARCYPPTAPKEWAKHLRPFGRRRFWKSHRRDEEGLVEEWDEAGRESPLRGGRCRKAKKLRLEYRDRDRIGGPGSGSWDTYWRHYATERDRRNALRQLGRSWLGSRVFEFRIPPKEAEQ